MPQFKYTAKGIGSDVVEGVLEARSEEEAIALLQTQGLFPLQMSSDLSGLSSSQPHSYRMRKRDFSLFVRQLYDMLSSGVTLLRALEIVESQAQGKDMKEVLNGLLNSVRKGERFSDALRLYPLIFNHLFVNLVRSGEASGALDQVLMRLADFAEAQEEMRSKVKAALAYPIFVSVVGFGVIGVLLGFVVPRMSGIFEDLGQRLPFLTSVLIYVSHAVSVYGWILLIAAVFGFLAFKKHRKTEEGSIFWEKLFLRIPFFGEIHRDSEIARLTRTLHMLLANGVSFTESLEIIQGTLKSMILEREIENLAEGVKKGERIRERLKKSKFLPVNVVNMLTVGEESGELEKSLKRIAESYERLLDRDIKLATSLLEPVMILIIGSVVGFIVMAMLLPIFQINFLVK